MTGQRNDMGTAGSLHGVTVVDCSRVLAGPYAAQMLGDHGADVIKVEPPAGDGTRLWGPADDGVSPYYAGLNRNKRHVSVDLSTEAGRAVLLALLADADVLIENFLPGTMDGWGMGQVWLLERFPRLVYCRITAFGTTGPMAGLPGYDAVIQAYSGLMDLNGEPDGPPVRIPMPVVDLTAGTHAFSGILLALHERHRSGYGQLVDVSLLDSALSLHHPAAANYFATGRQPQRLGSGHPNIAPCDVFEGADGYVYISAGTDRQFAQLCRFLGAPELATDPRFATNADRLRNRDELAEVLSAQMKQVGLTDDAVADLLASGVPASTIRRLSEVLADPQVTQREMALRVGDYDVVGIPVKLSRTPGSVRTPPRPQGADTVATLQRLGLSAELIDTLMKDAAVVGPSVG